MKIELWIRTFTCVMLNCLYVRLSAGAEGRTVDYAISCVDLNFLHISASTEIEL